MPNADQFPNPDAKPLMTMDQLGTLLRKYNISTGEWGKGNAKTIDDLLSEINAKETLLVEEGGKLIRLTKALGINVYCVAAGKTFRLKEDRQVFTDGRVRVRDQNTLDTSLGEKLSEGESREHALARALREELGVMNVQTYVEGKNELIEREYGSFPHLFTRHHLYRYDIMLREDDFKSEGYIEKQPTKSTYFVWEEVEKPSTLLSSFLASSAGQGSR